MASLTEMLLGAPTEDEAGASPRVAAAQRLLDAIEEKDAEAIVAAFDSLGEVEDTDDAEEMDS